MSKYGKHVHWFTMVVLWVLLVFVLTIWANSAKISLWKLKLRSSSRQLGHSLVISLVLEWMDDNVKFTCTIQLGVNIFMPETFAIPWCLLQCISFKMVFLVMVKSITLLLCILFLLSLEEFQTKEFQLWLGANWEL